VDPAIATGPFITTTNDALGLLIYFWFITLLYY
jgi:magnesium transporter